ncbi:MAG TPA: PAS domain S-box protein [Bacteroidales bacterium]|nr:PAS domain S-box protein [Bacteroidales bacterium]
MNNHYKVLIVEDNPPDVDLAKREVRHALESVEFSDVYTEEKFLDSLKNFKPDIIVSDFSMPNFDGLMVIKLTKKHSPLTPVIIFTGSIDEETAAETVKAGAVDYVIKEHTIRLRQAILLALEKKQMWQERLITEEKLRESEERFRILFEQAADGIIRVGQDGTIIDINASGLEMTGYHKAELVKKNVSIIFLKEELNKKPIRYDLLNKGITIKNERTLLKKDGNTCEVEMHSKMMPDKTYQSIARDITQRKKVERELRDSEERLQNVIQSLPVGVVIHSNKKILFANPAAYKLMEFPANQSLSEYNILDFIHPDYQKLALKRIEQTVSKTIKNELVEQEFLTFTKKKISVEVTSLPLVQKEGLSVMSVFNDITSRKQAEKEIRDSEERLNNLIQLLPIGVVIHHNGKVEFANTTASVIMEIPEKTTILGQNAYDFIHPDYKDIALQRINKSLTENNTSEVVELVYQTFNKRPISVEVSSLPIVFKGKTMLLTVFNDISARKKAETLLKESEAKYRSFFENTGTAIAISEEDATLSLINQKYAELVGLPKEEIENKRRYTEFISSEDLDDSVKIHELRLRNPEKASKSYEFKFKNAKGEIRNILVYADMIPGTKKSLASLLDITDRKKAETQIKESEAIYRAIFENTGTASIIIDEDTTISLVNSQFTELIGLPKEEIEHKRSWTEFVVPEDLEKMKIMHNLRRTDPSKALRSYEFSLKDVHENIKNILLFIDLIPGTKNSIASLLDITEIKKANKEILENERRFRNIIELANISLSIVAFDGTIEYINQQAVKTFGYEYQDIPTMERWWTQAYPDEKYRKEALDQWTALVNKAIEENKEIERKEYQVTCKDGSVKTMIIFGVIVNDKVLCLFEDITERKNAEEELRKSRMLLRTMIDSLQIWISAIDLDGKYFIANKFHEEFFKRPLYSIEGHNMREIFSEKDYKKHKDYFDECIRTGKSIEVSNEIHNKEDKILHVFGTYTPLFDKDRKIFGIASLVMDISQQKTAEIALKESEEQFRTTFENAPIGMSLNTINGNFFQVNQAFCQMMGYTQEELQKFNFSDITFSEDIEASRQFIRNLLTQNLKHTFMEKRYVKKDGSVIWAITSASVLRDINDNPKFVVVQVLDITELKMTEQKLEEAKNQLEIVFDNGPDAILLTRIEDGFYIDSNKTFTKYTGYTPDDLRGKSTLDIDIWDNPKDRDILLHEVKTKGFCHNLELVVKNKNGTKRIIDMSAEVIVIRGIPHLLSISRDIVERKKMEELLQKQNNDLYELNATKDRFFSIIAHDLKDPHNAILGYSEILSENYDLLSEQDKKNYINNILLSSKSLSRLLQNLLDWANSQTGRMVYKPELLDITKVIKETMDLLHYQAKIKQIRLITDIDSSSGIFADPNMTRTILRNLVSNAIKFTRRNGFVKITTTDITDKKTDYIEISVVDNGVGINKENLEKLFKLDHKVKTSGTEEETGSGLGLILCKELVEKNKGTMSIISEENIGTTVSFTLPKKIQ